MVLNVPLLGAGRVCERHASSRLANDRLPRYTARRSRHRHASPTRFGRRAARGPDFPAGACFPVRGRASHQFASGLQRCPTTGSVDHPGSSFRTSGKRSKGEGQLHYRNRRPCAQSSDSRERWIVRRPPSSADGEDLEISPRDLQRRSYRDRRQDRVFYPVTFRRGLE